MWTRRELKEKGKRGFNRNYWKTVLVSLIALFLLGGTIGGSDSSWSPISGFFGAGSSAASSAAAHSIVGEVDESFNALENEADSLEEYLDENGYQGMEDYLEHNYEGEISDSDIEDFADFANEAGSFFGTAAGIFLIIIVAIILLIIIALAILISAFLENPLHVGLARFFVRNLNTEAEVRELAYGYDHGYLNNVKVMFFKGLYTFFWSLLFIIPGIIKSYEYRMIPYILSEDPEMEMKAVFAKSKAMMSGQKWKAFVLDLSFIGWELLSLLTLGLLGIFYVNPYRNMTYAALYEVLEYGPSDSTPAYAANEVIAYNETAAAPVNTDSAASEDTEWNSETTY